MMSASASTSCSLGVQRSESSKFIWKMILATSSNIGAPAGRSSVKIQRHRCDASTSDVATLRLASPTLASHGASSMEVDKENQGPAKPSSAATLKTPATWGGEAHLRKLVGSCTAEVEMHHKCKQPARGKSSNVPPMQMPGRSRINEVASQGEKHLPIIYRPETECTHNAFSRTGEI